MDEILDLRKNSKKIKSINLRNVITCPCKIEEKIKKM